MTYAASPSSASSAASAALSFTALDGLGEVVPGTDLADFLASALAHAEARTGDILVIAQKIVSKAENRFVDLNQVKPSAEANELAALTLKDARLVEVILSESTAVLRTKPNVLIVRHRLGFVMANAGIDRSNVASGHGEDRVLLLPLDPDRSAARLRTALSQRLKLELGIIVSDSFGRPWRNGVVNIALGAAGIPSLIDRRGETDRHQRKLEMTEVAFADAIAAGAGLAMGEAAEGTPAVLVRGARWTAAANDAQTLIRRLSEDLFQ